MHDSYTLRHFKLNLNNLRQAIVILASLLLLTVLLGGMVNAQSNTVVLSNNSGTGSTIWQIQGERTMVINGFDLTPLTLPANPTVTAVNFAVSQPVSGQTATLVVYADSNGGPPTDATLIHQQEVNFASSGNVSVPLTQPVAINAPVLWVGFYLPVGFEFQADTSGSSVLTYWAWTSGSTFNVSSLSSAGVIGPSDGSAPVNLDIGGIARLSVTVSQGTGATTGGQPAAPVTGANAPLGRQINTGATADTNLLNTYPTCDDNLRYDPADINITARGIFQLHCREEFRGFAPGQIRNLNQVDSSVPGWQLGSGKLYNLHATGEYRSTDPNDDPERLFVPVTHCLVPAAGELNSAVVAIAYGTPHQWDILPTQRYGNLICAEVTHKSYVSYLVPQASADAQDSNLIFSGTPKVRDLETEQEVDALVCGVRYLLEIAVRNEGFDPVPGFVVRVEDVVVRTGQIIYTREYGLPPLTGGETTQYFTFDFIAPTTYINEAHRLVFTIDPRRVTNENNTGDNTFIWNYVMIQGNKC